MGSVRRMSRMRWGIRSIGGTGKGNRRKTGSKAVEIGIASSRLDELCLISVIMSLVVRINVKNAMKRVSSK